MNSAANQDINVKVSSSKEDFWKQHAVLQKGGGLSRAEYCRKNKLNYNCLGYWLYKWKKYRVNRKKAVREAWGRSGPWFSAATSAMNFALNRTYFENLGWPGLINLYNKFKINVKFV